MKARRLALAGAALLLASVAPTAVAQLPVDLDTGVLDGVEAASRHDVEVVDNAFEPDVFETEAGATVVWQQTGQNPHSVTSEDDGQTFDSSPNCSFGSTDQCMQQGATFSHTFESAGTFAYFCRIHRDIGMTGTIEVSAAGDVTTTSSAPTTPTTETAEAEGETDGEAGTAQALPTTGPQAALALAGTALLAAAAALRRFAPRS